MLQTLFQAPQPHLQLEIISLEEQVIHLKATAIQAGAVCPSCSQLSKKIHSCYQRQPADLPIGGRVVSFCLQVRRFECTNNDCSQQIFCERIPWMVRPYARRTKRLEDAQRLVAFALGGEPGSRLLSGLAMPTSPDTLLRLIRSSPGQEAQIPRVLGVDDWAFRKGDNYGTILVDLEQHQVVDLLDSREAEALANWLRENPGVEIISRDRSGAYAKGATDGAPDAAQVADRWHLSKNLSEAVERLLSQHQSVLREVSQAAVELKQPEIPAQDEQISSSHDKEIQPQQLNLQEQKKQFRLARYDEVKALHQQGFSQAEIAQKVGLSTKTIWNYLKGPFRDWSHPNRRRKLDRFEGFLQKRWEDGCQNVKQLWLELTDQGYRGSLRSVQRYIKPWRRESSSKKRQDMNREKNWTPKTAVWLLMEKKAELQEEEKQAREKLFELCPPLKEASEAAKEFQQMLREKTVDKLEGWMVRAEKLGPEFKSFVNGLRRDLEAVKNAFSMPWSNGQTEGQVNRLKTIKRQMVSARKRA